MDEKREMKMSMGDAATSLAPRPLIELILFIDGPSAPALETEYSEPIPFT